MEAKVGAAVWAWEQGVGVVICNGNNSTSIRDVMSGRRIGTFFSEDEEATSGLDMAERARAGCRNLQVEAFISVRLRLIFYGLT
jgi:delta-1-pyrroline-5-carboxylate synthetase